MQPSVLVIQHIACETSGLIGQVLRQHGVRLVCVRVHHGDRVPHRLGDHAGLVVLGGPMSVYDQERLAHLRAEIRLIGDALAREKPILGVCLGSQLLAAALGAEVKAGPGKEIGWFPITLSKETPRDALLHGLPGRFTALHWHGDVFELPRGAVSLASSKLTRHQAFRFGAKAYGILFHVELNARSIRRWGRVFRRELLGAGGKRARLEAGIQRHAATMHELGRIVFERWAALLTSDAGLRGSAGPAMFERERR